jgi:hypothetical protein
MASEFRVYLLPKCIINPPPAARAQRAAAGVLAVLAPKLIEGGIGALGALLKNAGEKDTTQIAASEFSYMYETNDDQQLSVNSELGCVLGVYGVFEDADDENTHFDDAALKALEKAGIIQPNADISIVFEAAIVPTADRSACYLELRHFSVREFIGGRRDRERDFLATFSIATPNATTDGSVIAAGTIDLGELVEGAKLVGKGKPLGDYPRYRSNLMPWAQITGDAKAAYDSDVKREMAKNKKYMPVTFALAISETADGNAFLAKLGELLVGNKDEIAKGIGGFIDPAARAAAAKEDADAAEALLAAEENAIIAVKEAEGALAASTVKPEQKPALEAKLAKARRALSLATRAREAAGLDAPI